MKISLCLCRNAFALSDLLCKLVVSFRGCCISGLCHRYFKYCGCERDSVSWKMFGLMYFPVGRKTHVVAFNLIRVMQRRRVVRTKHVVLFFEVFYSSHK